MINYSRLSRYGPRRTRAGGVQPKQQANSGESYMQEWWRREQERRAKEAGATGVPGQQGPQGYKPPGQSTQGPAAPPPEEREGGYQGIAAAAREEAGAAPPQASQTAAPPQTALSSETPTSDTASGATVDTTADTTADPWAQTAAGQVGISETNQWANDVNRFQDALDVFGSGDINAIKEAGYTVKPTQSGWQVWWTNLNGTGAWYSLDEVKNYVQQDYDDSLSKAQQAQNQQDFFDDLQDWGTSQWEGDGESGVSIFGEEQNAWEEAVKGVFGELSNVPDGADLLSAFKDMFNVEDFTAEAMPGLTDEQRTTAFFDAMKEQGLDIELINSPDTDKREAYLDKLREEAARFDPETWFDIDDSDYQEIRGTYLGILIEQIGRKGVMSEAEINRAVTRFTAPAAKKAIRDLNKSLARHAAAGRGYSGAVGRTVADVQQAIAGMKMEKAGELFIDSMKLAEQGRREAISELANIEGDDLEAMLKKAELYGTLAGDRITFLTEIAKIDTGNSQVDAQNYNTLANQHVKIAELELESQLQLAGLDVEKYKIDTGYAVDKMHIDLEAHFRQQGLSLEAAKFKADQIVNQWNAATAAADMVQNGHLDRLSLMSDLALKGEQGDREAWAQYEQLRLSEQLQNRGMDIDVADMVSNLMWNIQSQKNQFNFEAWRTQYMAAHERQLTHMGISADENGAWLDFIGGAAPGIIPLLGGGGGDATDDVISTVTGGVS